jgi:hypothetical protein
MKIPIGVKNSIEELYRVRQQLKLFEKSEAEITDAVKVFMFDNEITLIGGTTVQARLFERPQHIVNPEEFLEALGGDVDPLFKTCTIRLDGNAKKGTKGVRDYLGNDVIEAISNTVWVPVLAVEKLKPQEETRPNQRRMSA